MDKLYSIAELAEEFTITPRAIRFYETKGLLTPQRAGNTRVYTYRDRARLIVVLRAKRLGYSLDEIKEYLDLYDQSPKNLAQTQHLLLKTRERMGDLKRQMTDLEVTLEELSQMEAETVELLKGLGEDPNGPEVTPA